MDGVEREERVGKAERQHGRRDRDVQGLPGHCIACGACADADILS